MRQRIATTVGVAVLLGTVSMFVAPTAGAEEPTAGYLYGTVTTNSGNEYTGILRWGSEEAFWDDVFHSLKEELPYAELGESVDQERDDEKWWEALVRKVEEEFGDDGRPPLDTTFSTIEEFGHQAGRHVAQALDEHLSRLAMLRRRYEAFKSSQASGEQVDKNAS